MNFLVFPYNAVLNAGVFDDAVVADGHIGADGAVFDDYVLADVARGYQLDVVHRLVLANDVANVVERRPVQQQPGVCLNQRFGEPAVQPFFYGDGAEFAALFDHHLECVGQLEFSAGADVVAYQVLERLFELLDVFDVIDSDNGLVAYVFLRFFNKAFNMPVRVGDGYAESARVLDFVGVKEVLGGVSVTLNVGVEQRVAQNDEQRFVVVHVGECEADGLPQALRVALEDCARVAPFGLCLEVFIHLLGLVSGNEDGFGGLEREGVFYNPVDNGLAAHGQQALISQNKKNFPKIRKLYALRL